MSNSIRRLILGLSTFITIFLGSPLALAPAYAAAIDCNNPPTSKEEAQCGACQAAGNLSNCDPSGAPKTLSDTIATVINILSVFGGALAVIMLIIGGFRYIVSAGNAEQAKNARSTILYAIIGLVIVATAQLIVHFVINGINDCPKGKTATGQCK